MIFKSMVFGTNFCGPCSGLRTLHRLIGSMRVTWQEAFEKHLGSWSTGIKGELQEVKDLTKKQVCQQEKKLPFVSSFSPSYVFGLFVFHLYIYPIAPLLVSSFSLSLAVSLSLSLSCCLSLSLSFFPLAVPLSPLACSSCALSVCANFMLLYLWSFLCLTYPTRARNHRQTLISNDGTYLRIEA